MESELRWRTDRINNLSLLFFIFLDESKNLSYCGPKEFGNCVMPVNGKLLNIFFKSSSVQGSGPAGVQVNSIA